MFREMRRKRQAMSEAEAIEILKKHDTGVLGVSGDDGYPYTVPLNYIYEQGRLIFHCALEGHKIDGIRRNDKVSFCVIDQDEVIPEKFATCYRSVIVFGRAHILDNEAEKRAAIEHLVARITPGFVAEGQQEIKRDWKQLCMVEIVIEHVSAKTDIERAAKR